jgi:hypothetical protein
MSAVMHPILEPQPPASRLGEPRPPGTGQDELSPAALRYLAQVRVQLLAEEREYGLAIATLALGRAYATPYRRLVAALADAVATGATGG